MSAIDDLMAAAAPHTDTGEAQRDHLGRPMIWLPDGSRQAPYSRASSFGKQLEDTYNLELWKLRQAILGTAMSPQIIAAVNAIGPTDPVNAPPLEFAEKKRRKLLLDKQAEAAHEASGANEKAALGTAIHFGTEVIDKGDDLGQLAPNIRERAEAYWRFCREHGLRMTSIEEFGVEDEHQIAGTWDRTGFAFGKHCILDVKTSGSMFFAGIAFMVQLAAYSRMWWYDPKSGERRPHKEIDQDVAWIIHVGREPKAPVELQRVDIAAGWQYINLVRTLKDARNAGKRGIKHVELDDVAKAVARATSVSEIRVLHTAHRAIWNDEHTALARDMSVLLRRFGR